MIIKSFYLSEPNNLDLAVDLTGLSEDEIVDVVGKFAKHSHRAGQVRGELIEFVDGTVKLRHHFTKKILWRSNV